MNLNWFDTHYYNLLYKNRNEKEAQLFIDHILEKIKIKPNSKVLDLACGTGRHSKYLEKKGFNVVGVDKSEKNIFIAKKNENKSLKFFNQEMTTDINMKFDVVFNFFTSFGYSNDKYNHDTVENISKNLKPGGLFVIDFLNSELVRKNIVKSDKKFIRGINFNISRFIKNNCIYKNISFKDKNQQYNFTEKVMLLNLFDFKKYFSKNNFKILEIFGDYDLSIFKIEKSPRLILIAKKNPT
tara:strand:+ start:114 stop:833 length:720 start_codon:yes stop_codon:yes gene_type:complete